MHISLEGYSDNSPSFEANADRQRSLEDILILNASSYNHSAAVAS